jgi:hypothetical protein
MEYTYEGLQHPGEFILDDLLLVTSSGLEVDLVTSVMGLTLYEDLLSMTISGTIAIQDSINLPSYGPLIGQEYLYLKIRTPTFKDPSAIIDFSKNVFLVHTISKRQDIGNGVQGFVLNFVSQELVKNQRLKVVQSFTDPWSEIVLKLLTESKYLNTKKKIDIEATAGIKKFVAPNVRPMDLIVTGMKQAISEFKGEPTYLFYETLKGFNFRTLASLYNREEQLEYVISVPGTSVKESQSFGYRKPAGVIDVMDELQTVQSFEVVSNNDSITNYRTGMYGSKLLIHDIISKSYTTNTYNYHDNFADEAHIVGGVTANKAEFPLASALPITERGERVSDFPARTFMMPTSLTGGVDSQHTTQNNTNPYMAYDPHKWIQRRNSQMIQLENALQVNILVHGQTVTNVGDKVILNLPYTASVDTKRKDKFDRLYRGPFLIKRIRHDFNMSVSPRKHQMYINLVKDSLEEELLAPEDNLEPSAEAFELNMYAYT